MSEVTEKLGALIHEDPDPALDLRIIVHDLSGGEDDEVVSTYEVGIADVRREDRTIILEFKVDDWVEDRVGT